MTYVLDYLRTPRGKGSKRGALHGVSPVDLVVTLQKALAERGLTPALVEDVIIGTASQVNEQGANLARTATLLADWGDVPGGTLNRFCASGIDAVAQTSARITAGDLGLAVAGGVESTSRVPMFSDGGPLFCDPETIARIGSVHMGIAADLNATLEGWTRDQLDAYGLETQQKAAKSTPTSLVPVAGLDHDELVRPDTTPESLAGLEPAFATFPDQDEIALAAHPEAGELNHVHTVGTSPALADAAALLVLGDDQAAERAGLRPRARIVATATAATDPVIMLTAGQMAVEKVIARAGLRPSDIDVFEFAEAFAALCLRFRRDLDAGPDRLNPNGGTIAKGHAFGATGAIMVGDCVDELERRDARYGVAAVSGAAGLGVAVLLERV
ncbi:acetyl-CoA C-acyltransferase [Actinomadura barringtoniae]|uniref:Acetyl-CoA C-acyltransferase n=1 Tax=Actinomadura barringtoniae TaxID=1427535 RepID=A0A939PCL2_9ACTN|nr:acetyl-CoA C-acyltransferase [Actinomadura barringtoniae]MBO2450135.1 acetyl-CoA C-acyltransferase [Actinomadura barringtoniae]